MIHYLVKLRYLAIIVVLFAVLHTLGFLAIGAMKTWQAYSLLISEQPFPADKGPGIYMLESIDSFLVALVLLVFAIGISSLFLSGKDKKAQSTIPKWMQVQNLLELKLLLWEVILTVLVIAFVGQLVTQLQNLTWEILVIPTSILMLSVSFYLLKKVSIKR